MNRNQYNNHVKEALVKSKTIRFLKQGLVTIDMPDNLSIDEQIEFAKNHLDTMSDQDLVMAACARLRARKAR